jgi:hypothetical protein
MGNPYVVNLLTWSGFGQDFFNLVRNGGINKLGARFGLCAKVVVGA